MKSKNKAMWLELIGGIFGWIWIAAFIGTIYLLIQTIFYDGELVILIGVVLAGGISKAFLRALEERKIFLMNQEPINDTDNNKSANNHEPDQIEETEKIVQKYGKFLENSSPADGCVADQSKLPHSKTVIKTALIKALQNTADVHFQEALKTSYLSLAKWQPNVGNSNQGIDFSQIDPMIDPAELLALNESTKDWIQIVKNEEIQLQAELKKYGF